MRQRWFGSTGRRVPQIAVEGGVDLDGALVLDGLDDTAIRAAFDEGRPVVVRADSDTRKRCSGPSAARGLVGARRRPRTARAARPRPDGAHLWLSPDRRDVLDRRVRPRGWTLGRGDAVEVPRGRLGRPVGRAARRRGRDAGVREPALRAGRARAPPGRRVRRGGGRAADRGRRGTRAPPARHRRREGSAATYTGRSAYDWAGGRTGAGYAAQGNILVSGETVDALAETFESSRAPARRAPRRLPRRGAGGGRGQPRPAIGGAPRRRADGGYAGLSDVVVDLRVDDHERPIEELRRICTGSTTRSSDRRRARSG